MRKMLTGLMALSVMPGAVNAAEPVKVNDLSVDGKIKMTAIVEKQHPRIILTDTRVSEIRKLLQTEEKLQEIVKHLEKLGDFICTQPPAERQVGNKGQLLWTSRLVLARTLVLGTLYRLDGKSKWRDRLVDELKAVCAFEDWHPEHFLDTAEMSAAVALGYDWLYHDLSEPERETIREGLVMHGVTPGLKGGHWVKMKNNWNQVCLSGISLAALAVAEDYPEQAQELLERAKRQHVVGLRQYSPAGVYPEGPGYWGYGTSFSVLMVSALESVMEDDWGILDAPGFLESFDFRMHAQGPTGKIVNYADGKEGGGSSPQHLFIASRTDKPGYSTFALDRLQQELHEIDRTQTDSYTHQARRLKRFLALAVAWYVPEKKGNKPPLDWFGVDDGHVHVAFMRSAWGDRNALFASLKAGKLTASHCHLDAGSFIMESDGIRWASDLGQELEAYRTSAWGRKQNSRRWDYFRINNHGHNTLTIGDQLHRVVGSAPIMATSSGTSPFAVADLSAAFKGQAEAVKRGFAMPAREQFLVQDEIKGVPEGVNVRWNMLMRNEATVLSEDGRTAVLEEDGKTLTARLLAPGNARFKVTDATTDWKDENQNADFSRLIIDTPSDGNPMTIAVQFVPGSSPAADLKLTPLAQWK